MLPFLGILIALQLGYGFVLAKSLTITLGEWFNPQITSSTSRELLFKKSNIYNYGHLPFDEILFDTTLFQNKYYRFPSSYWIEEINEIAIADEYDEEKSTHPNPDARKEKILNLIKGTLNSNKGSYYQIGGEELFTYIRNVARFEIAKTLLLEHKYKKAVYHTYLLQREFKDNEYLDEIMSFALYYLNS